MASKRRKEYLPIAKDPKFRPYHKFFNQYRMESQILNGGSQLIPNVNTILWDKRSIIARLLELKGSEEQNGEYKDYYGDFKSSVMLITKLKLEEIEQRFINLNQQRWNSGMQVFKEMPEELFNEKLALPAREDVTLEELEELERQLELTKLVESKEDDSKVLSHGLRGNGKFHGTRAKDDRLINVLAIIDGQKVDEHNGLLIIKDLRSPYNGMAVVDYRKFCNDWALERQAVETKLRKLQETEIKEKGFSNIELPNFGVRKIDKASLPPFPSWAKNYLADYKPVAMKSGVVQRLKKSCLPPKEENEIENKVKIGI